MEKGERNSIEELFREKFEDAVTDPGRDLTRKFMRRLERREFMRFNPARFNIWYMGVAIISASALGLFLTTSTLKSGEKTGSEMNNAIQETTVIIDTVAVESEESVREPENQIISSEPSGIGDKRRNKTEERSQTETLIISAGKPDNTTTVISSHDSVLKEDVPLLHAKIIATASEGCVPFHISFRNISEADASYSWDFGDGGTSPEKEPEWIFNTPGMYRISLTLENGSGHTAVTYTTINVWPRPEASFEILPTDPSLPGDDITFINTSVGATSYVWHFGDGEKSREREPVHKYSSYGKYTVSLVAVSENGCADSLSIADAFSDTDCYLRFPNAFMPNKSGPVGGYFNRITDNSNMIFHPVFSGVIKYNLKIYSKQGYLVFESDDVYLGWDGYYKGQICASGVYIWKVEGKYRNGEAYMMSGDVTLVNY